MALDAAAGRPSKMSISNLDTAESIYLQYNPEEIEEAFGVVYARQTSPGLSHQILQYINTENVVLTFDLVFDALTNREDFDEDDALNARRFIHSLTLPMAGAATVRDGAPPRVLFVWPYLFAFTTVITKGRTKFRRFFKSGKPSLFTISLTIEELREFRITSEDVLADGTQRADSGGTSGDGGG